MNFLKERTVCLTFCSSSLSLIDLFEFCKFVWRFNIEIDVYGAFRIYEGHLRYVRIKTSAQQQWFQHNEIARQYKGECEWFKMSKNFTNHYVCISLYKTQFWRLRLDLETPGIICVAYSNEPKYNCSKVG